MTLYLNEIKCLHQVIESKDVEVLHWQSKLEHVQDESDVKFKPMQEKCDRIQARYVDAKERYLPSRTRLKPLLEITPNTKISFTRPTE